MINNTTETDSQFPITIPFGERFPLPFIQINETTGGKIIDYDYLQYENIDYIISAFRDINNLQNKEVADKARLLLFDIQYSKSLFKENTVLLLPPIYAFEADDGSALIEWICADFRIGFSIEPNSEKSSWYLTTKKEFGQITASGYLNSDNKKLILWLIFYFRLFINGLP